jgi:hypothetical protein
VRAAGIRSRHLPQKRRRRFNLRLRRSNYLTDDRADSANLRVNEIFELAALAAAKEHDVSVRN